MNQIQTELLKLLQSGKTNQSGVIKRLDDLYRKHGCVNIEKWRNMSNKRNSFLHELVEKEMDEVIRHIVLEQKFDVNTRRDSDGHTALQLAMENENFELVAILQELGGIEIETVDVSTMSFEEEKENSMNIVWLDLEMTSIENPEIMECAVIITDKDLNTLAQANWVIHFEQSVLNTLEEWHQKTFANTVDGGNGLFAEVLKSKLEREQVEQELLTLIKRHCPKEKCPLAGSSIHTDKAVLKRCMPKVDEYLSYRIIDVSSFQAILRRWTPWIETTIKKQVATGGQETVNHRAMDDIKWSIAFMRQFRQFLPKSASVIKQNRSSSSHHSHEASSNYKKGASSPYNHGGSSNYNKGASSSYDQGGSSQYNRRGSNHYDRGTPNPHPRGLSNHYSPGASHHQSKHSNSDSQEEDNDDLPNIRPNVDSMNLYSDEKRLVERINLEKHIKVKDLVLTSKEKQIYYLNPHLREVFLNRQQVEKYNKEFNKENRYLTAEIQQMGKINAVSKKYSTTEHWGQRKLLLTEIEFLTKHGSDDDYLVVYAGAAPGSHINYLSSIFPGLEFVLIDDKEFSLKQNSKIQIQPEKFTLHMARKYTDSNRRILFICNIRTFRTQADGQSDATEDMQNQLDWYKTIKPHASLLNFRLPRASGKTSYLKGHLIIEPWASRRAVECRLVVKKDAKMVDYDHHDFDHHLFHFQNVTRVMYYPHDMDNVDNEGLDHCYDCRAEIFILEEYLTKIQNVKPGIQMRDGIAKMSRDISKEIDDKKRPQFMNVPRTLNVIPKKNFSTNV